MLKVRVRHFTEADVPVRTALLLDAAVLANLNGDAATRSVEELHAAQVATIRTGQHDKMILTAETAKGRVLGFLWLTSIDWRSRSCEASIAMLPDARFGMGALAFDAMSDFVFDDLNMLVVVNQVLAHNTMMQSSADVEGRAQVTSPYDCYTSGAFRTSQYWTETAEQYRARHAARRAARPGAVRVAAAPGGAS